MTILIAITIFYISSLTFPPGEPVHDTRAILYHFYAFFFLSFFILISLTQGKLNNKNLIFIGIIIAIMYGILDEFHQFYVPGRYCSFKDFLIDSAGILFAGTLYSLPFAFRSNSLQSKNFSDNHTEYY